MRTSASLAIGDAVAAPNMRPAAGLGDQIAGEQLVEPGIAVDVDDAPKLLQVCPWVLALGSGE